jgi:hypothetical protein
VNVIDVSDDETNNIKYGLIIITQQQTRDKNRSGKEKKLISL